MPYATLLVYVDADTAPVSRVRLASDLALKFNATLIGISALGIKPPFVAEGVVIEEVTEGDVRAMREKLVAKGKWFRGIAGDQRKLDWCGVLAPPAEALPREARSADLVIIGRSKAPGDSYVALDPAGAILKMGRPTLVVPKAVGHLSAENLLIGWKDTREARRAILDALPFLQEASRVTVAEVCAPGEEEAAHSNLAAVSTYLFRHRIQCGPQVILRQEGSGASQLIQLAQQEGAELLVTGAYGHSRLGEWIFGGVTQELLASSPICCLMSH